VCLSALRHTQGVRPPASQPAVSRAFSLNRMSPAFPATWSPLAMKPMVTWSVGLLKRVDTETVSGVQLGKTRPSGLRGGQQHGDLVVIAGRKHRVADQGVVQIQEGIDPVVCLHVQSLRQIVARLVE